MISRDERQAQALKAWIKSKGRGTIVAATGVGKTRIAMNAIALLRTKYPTLSVIVVVPTQNLKEQWTRELVDRGLNLHTEVKVMMGASKQECECDLLIIDEAHRVNAECISQIFDNVRFKLILGLTATFERLDGRHEILAKHAPVVDTITMREAMLNGWVSSYTDYVVLIDVPDINKYRDYDAKFNEYFEFFDRDFSLIMSMVGPKGFVNKLKYRDILCRGDVSKQKDALKAITVNANGFMRMMQARKKFVQEHPEKLRIAEEIIANRKDSKIITFSANVKMAESFSEGFVFTGKDSKKKNRTTLEEFSKLDSGVLHTVKLAEEGLNLPDLSVGIMLGVNSSKTKATQTLGRIVRLAPNKHAEFFTLVINDTIETEWMRRSRINGDYIVIDEENLLKVLRGEPYEPYKRKLKNFTYRF